MVRAFPVSVKPCSVSFGTDKGWFGLLKMFVVVDFFSLVFLSFHFCLNLSSLRGCRLRWKLGHHFHGRLARSSHVAKASNVPWWWAQCFRLHASEPGPFLLLPAPAQTPPPAHPSSPPFG